MEIVFRSKIIIILLLSLQVNAQLNYVIKSKNGINDTILNRLIVDSLSFSGLKMFDSKTKMTKLFPNGKFDKMSVLEKPEDDGKPYTVTYNLYRTNKSFFELLENGNPVGVVIKDNTLSIVNFNLKVNDSIEKIKNLIPFSYKNSAKTRNNLRKVIIPLYKSIDSPIAYENLYLFVDENKIITIKFNSELE